MSIEKLLSLRDENARFKHGKFLTLYLIQFLAAQAGFISAGVGVGITTYDVQFHSAWYNYVGWFLGGHLFLSKFEWFYHRYLLHTVIWRWLRSQCDTHTHHHDLTDVTTIKNEYEIEHSHQNESATFPVYALGLFCLIFTVIFFLPLQIIFPGSPVLISCNCSVTFSLVLYEVYHAAMHLSYERYWKKWVERFHLIRQLYGFHLMHHANMRINQAIGGFFFLPIWDWAYGTYFVPSDSLPLPGKTLPQKLPVPHKARRLTRYLDELANEKQKRIARKDAEKRKLEAANQKL